MFLNPGNLKAVAYETLHHCLQDKKKLAQQDILSIADSHATKGIKDRAKPPQKGLPISSVLEDASFIYQHRTKMNHPRFFGFIPSPASEFSWLGDILNTAHNSNGAAWVTSSGASAVESSLIEWAAEQVGLPKTAGGCFLSGGSMANLTALAAARDEILTFEERQRAVIYCSAQTHCSNTKALRILGFHESQICKIAVDTNNRIRADLLDAAVRRHRLEGKRPFCIMATCGTTNTGSIDPLYELSIISRREKMWLHVDGAYGASVVLSKSHKHLVKDLQYCDSLSWDFHKWMFQVFGCVLVLVRDKQHLRQSFATGGDYLRDAGEGTEEYPNYWNYGPEMSRPARGMKLWFSLQMLGLDNVGEMIDHGFALSQTAEASLRSLPDWDVVSASQLGIVCFRYAPAGRTTEELDDLNKRISQTALETNVAAPFTTQLGGRTVLRMCSINPELPVLEMVEIVHKLDKIARDLTCSFHSPILVPPHGKVTGESKSPIMVEVREVECSAGEEEVVVKPVVLGKMAPAA